MEDKMKDKIGKLNMTQKEFGELISVDRMTLRNYNLGRAPKKADNYLKLVFYIIDKEGLDKLKDIFGE